MAKSIQRKTRRSASDRRMAAALLELIKKGKDTRLKKVATIRKSLRGERYVNSLKWDVALERLIDSTRQR